jgi:hypothetical protein
MLHKIPKKLLKAITIPWQPPFHGCLKKWHKWSEAALKRGGFTNKNANAAWDWSTCACGEAYACFDGMVADYKNDGPRDRELEDLGVKFAEAVSGQSKDVSLIRDSDSHVICINGGNPKEALSILKQIEQRLTQLDREFKSAHKKALKYYQQSKNLQPLIDLFAGINKEIEFTEEE